MTRVVHSLTKSEKREFVAEKYEELVQMGFSPVRARRILLAAQPKLAILSAEWAIASCEVMLDELQFRRAKLLAKSSVESSKVGLKPITPEEIRNEILKPVEEGIETFSNLLTESSVEQIQAVGKVFFERGLVLPMGKPARVLRILCGAQAAMEELPFPTRID